jgi:hypothetical protein
MLIINKNLELNEFLAKNKYTPCTGCSKSLVISATPKKKIPIYTRCNSLDPGSIPDEIRELNDIELTLVQQVRPYLKIISLKGNILALNNFIQKLKKKLRP